MFIIKEPRKITISYNKDLRRRVHRYTKYMRRKFKGVKYNKDYNIEFRQNLKRAKNNKDFRDMLYEEF